MALPSQMNSRSSRHRRYPYSLTVTPFVPGGSSNLEHRLVGPGQPLNALGVHVTRGNDRLGPDLVPARVAHAHADVAVLRPPPARLREPAELRQILLELRGADISLDIDLAVLLDLLRSLAQILIEAVVRALDRFHLT